jgi:hypothetical protein
MRLTIVLAAGAALALAPTAQAKTHPHQAAHHRHAAASRAAGSPLGTFHPGPVGYGDSKQAETDCAGCGAFHPGSVDYGAPQRTNRPHL